MRGEIDFPTNRALKKAEEKARHDGTCTCKSHCFSFFVFIKIRYRDLVRCVERRITNVLLLRKISGKASNITSHYILATTVRKGFSMPS